MSRDFSLRSTESFSFWPPVPWKSKTSKIQCCSPCYFGSCTVPLLGILKCILRQYLPLPGSRDHCILHYLAYSSQACHPQNLLHRSLEMCGIHPTNDLFRGKSLIQKTLDFRFDLVLC